MKTYKGKLLAEGLKFGIVVARFNEFITSKLLTGAIDALERHGATEANIELIWVPGAFEIPIVVKKMTTSTNYNAVICLGAVIRDGTPNFDSICAEVTKGIGHVSLDSGIPIIFGVLTTETIEQAVERAGTKAGNKGFDAAVTAIEMANLLNSM